MVDTPPEDRHTCLLSVRPFPTPFPSSDVTTYRICHLQREQRLQSNLTSPQLTATSLGRFELATTTIAYPGVSTSPSMAGHLGLECFVTPLPRTVTASSRHRSFCPSNAPPADHSPSSQTYAWTYPGPPVALHDTMLSLRNARRPTVILSSPRSAIIVDCQFFADTSGLAPNQPIHHLLQLDEPGRIAREEDHQARMFVYSDLLTRGIGIQAVNVVINFGSQELGNISSPSYRLFWSIRAFGSRHRPGNVRRSVWAWGRRLPPSLSISTALLRSVNVSKHLSPHSTVDRGSTARFQPLLKLDARLHRFVCGVWEACGMCGTEEWVVVWGETRGMVRRC
jgi:hypothetical protein